MKFNSKIYLSFLGFQGDEVANSKWYREKKKIELIKFPPDVRHQSDNNGLVDSKNVPPEDYCFFVTLSNFKMLLMLLRFKSRMRINSINPTLF